MSINLQTYAKRYQYVQTRMSHRKHELIAEIILSFFILVITVNESFNASVAVGSIAFIHSFNITRAVEAYRESKYQDRQNLDEPEKYR